MYNNKYFEPLLFVQKKYNQFFSPLMKIFHPVSKKKDSLEVFQWYCVHIFMLLDTRNGTSSVWSTHHPRTLFKMMTSDKRNEWGTRPVQEPTSACAGRVYVQGCWKLSTITGSHTAEREHMTKIANSWILLSSSEGKSTGSRALSSSRAIITQHVPYQSVKPKDCRSFCSAISFWLDTAGNAPCFSSVTAPSQYSMREKQCRKGAFVFNPAKNLQLSTIFAFVAFDMILPQTVRRGRDRQKGETGFAAQVCRSWPRVSFFFCVKIQLGLFPFFANWKKYGEQETNHVTDSSTQLCFFWFECWEIDAGRFTKAGCTGLTRFSDSSKMHRPNFHIARTDLAKSAQPLWA